MKVAIAGGPRTGKTTFALETFGASLVRHTDDLIGSHDWSEASLAASQWFNEPGVWCIEGVAVPRALRKWLAANPGKPCDRVYWLTKAHTPLSAGQATMAKGCVKVWLEVLPELRLRGVEVIDV